MAKCRLCQLDRKLCDSHIAPEFLYKPLYNDENKLMAISGQGNKGWKPLQVGMREHLLCLDCEQHLNDKYEKAFLKQWTIDSPLPDRMAQDSAHTAVYDYPTFKLFHLSVLFRSSICSLPTFQEVNLGSHEERIRQMLLSADPGCDWEYPVLAFAVLNGRGDVERRLISRPISGRYEGHIAYGQIYGGAMWWISVSSHRNHAFCQAGLQSTGSITMLAEPWNEIGVVQDLSEALKRVNARKA